MISSKSFNFFLRVPKRHFLYGWVTNIVFSLRFGISPAPSLRKKGNPPFNKGGSRGI